jgi:hypothetical protein
MAFLHDKEVCPLAGRRSRLIAAQSVHVPLTKTPSFSAIILPTDEVLSGRETMTRLQVTSIVGKCLFLIFILFF